MVTTLRLFLVLILATLLPACATLRTDVPREPSHALAPDPGTPLGRIAGRLVTSEDASSFRLLESGRSALAARLALIHYATRTLDLQYYLFKIDISGQVVVDALLKAADRGVRVRLLLDDIDTAANEQVIIALDTHKNVQVRLYNPFRVRGNAPLGRAFEFLGDKGRLNRRMHNKLFLADNHFGITGGRNIGDEYFQVEHEVTFRDLDVMAAGKLVRDMSKSFDAYWNSAHSVPARAIPYPGKRRQLLAEQRAALDAYRAEVQPLMENFLDLDALRDPKESGLGPWTAGRGELVDDPPDKTEGAVVPRELPVARLMRMVRDARDDVLISSPYFVPKEKGAEFFADIARKGVSVRILTNSLAANDVSVVHAGYARYRRPLLAAGVELYELKPSKERPGMRVLTSRGSSRASLHTKAMVVDKAQVYVGSMNLDPRSAWLNTETGLLVHCPDLAGQVSRFIEASMTPEQSYRVLIDPDSDGEEGRLVWLDKKGDKVARHTEEPRTNMFSRLLIRLLGAFPIEDEL